MDPFGLQWTGQRPCGRNTMIRILLFLDTIFSLWMLVDAIRRRAQTYWYPVVMMPFGEWVYFFVVKIHDPEFNFLRDFYKRFVTPKVTTDQVRRQYDETRSFANTLTLAQALYDDGAYAEAAELFGQALRLQDDSRDALYGLALTQLRVGESEPAIESLRRLIERDPAFEEYAPWADLAQALAAAGLRDEAIELLEILVVKSPRLEHRVFYAHFLHESGRGADARAQLELGIEEYKDAPKFLKRRKRRWFRQAKQMLKAMPTTA